MIIQPENHWLEPESTDVQHCNVRQRGQETLKEFTADPLKSHSGYSSLLFGTSLGSL